MLRFAWALIMELCRWNHMITSNMFNLLRDMLFGISSYCCYVYWSFFIFFPRTSDYCYGVFSSSFSFFWKPPTGISITINKNARRQMVQIDWLNEPCFRISACKNTHLLFIPCWFEDACNGEWQLQSTPSVLQIDPAHEYRSIYHSKCGSRVSAPISNQRAQPKWVSKRIHSWNLKCWF